MIADLQHVVKVVVVHVLAVVHTAEYGVRQIGPDVDVADGWHQSVIMVIQSWELE